MVNNTNILNVQNDSKQEIRMATVTELFELGTAKITFYGEDVPSEKEYSYLASYIPDIGDKVLLISILDTYIIVGKILHKEVPEIGITEENIQDIIEPLLEHYETKESLSLKLADYVKTSILENYALTLHTHTNVYSNGYRSGFLTSVNNVPSFVPSLDDVQLGASSYKWKELYAKSGTILTSDERKKKDIEVPDERYLEFLLDLKPVRYKMKDGESDRYHLGFLSQDIENDLERNNIDNKEFAGFIKSPIEKDGEIIDHDYALRYDEFGALYALGIQTLFNKMKILEDEVNDLRREISHDTSND